MTNGQIKKYRCHVRDWAVARETRGLPADDEARMAAIVKQGETSVARLKFAADQASASPRLLWESGEIQLTFANTAYRSEWQPLTVNFPVAPQVFIGESIAGNWVFVKVDFREKTRFKWAARSFSGGAIDHTTSFSWFAVSKVAELAPPDPNQQPLDQPPPAQ